MDAYLDCLRVSQADLKSLKVIHVTGTKGKGSTCAFAENLLRRHGAATGFFSSPHLISITERIRLNGASIDDDEFAKYLWVVWGKIKACGLPVPSFFRLMTMLSLYVFKKKKVDVAVVEVGIGGKNDATNIVDNPSACAVTSVGLDHTEILGDTEAEIALEKSGIFKRGAAAFSAYGQRDDVTTVLADSARRVGEKLQIAPPLTTYRTPYNSKLVLGLSGHFQKVNASLAVAVANYWLQRHRGPSAALCSPSGTLTASTLEALSSTDWPGRAQIIKLPQHEKTTFFVDGAHTLESITACADWFRDEYRRRGKNCRRVLLFNCSPGRDPLRLLRPLARLSFDEVVFTSYDERPALPHPRFAQDAQAGVHEQMAAAWPRLLAEEVPEGKNSEVRVVLGAHRAVEHVLSRETGLKMGEEQLVLGTGSIWLVGNLLKTLQPEKRL
eukprot:TRINITY_DN2864_c0_g1_i2.p1 TRINITY_DN2864_c0_g1~~TRINITY_DN2864_c0_g1_i2.p1  ORF type:complete len:493 (-),score=120.57 TRINITY_DN2864_c0_g1_i2:1157-2479(-)